MLIYYSSSLDPILQKDPTGTEASLDKMPFANVPQELGKTTGDFAVSGISLSHSIADLYQIWLRESDLVRQYRLTEAKGMFDRITAGLPQAWSQLDLLKTSAEATGEYLKITSLDPETQTVLTYNEVMDKIKRLEDLLNLLARQLLPDQKLPDLINSATPEQLSDFLNSLNPDLLAKALDVTPEQLPDLLNPANSEQLKKQLNSIPPESLPDLLNTANPDILKNFLKPTDLTLEITPLRAFVGDYVNYQGWLSSQNSPVADRQVEILLNSSSWVVVNTDSQGRFQGQLQIPYWYIHSIEVQAIYYPTGPDVGVYLGSASSVIPLDILFYQAVLTIQAGGPAYPGREAAVSGNMDYGSAPVLEPWPAGLYLDDIMLNSFSAETNFTLKLPLSPDIATGQHTLLVSAPASGRYAPVNATCPLNVVKATVVLDLDTPRLGIIPGSLDVNGRAYSELGPVQGAIVTTQIDQTSVQAVTSADGTFSIKLPRGPEFSLIGSQPVTVDIQPQEPWNTPVSVTRKIFMVNVINCAILFLVLVLLGFYLPRRFRKWFGAFGENPPAPEETPFIPPPPPLPEEVVKPVIKLNPLENDGTPEVVLKWYRFILRLVQRMTRAVIKPQQTLREYARDSGPSLGPLSRPFSEFTLLIERFLYSPHKATPEEIARSQELSQNIREEAKNEDL